jgi:hypothetical protein
VSDEPREFLPTLGPQVCDYLETNYTDGDGKPLRLGEYQRAWVWKLFEVFPPDHELAGQRVFPTVEDLPLDPPGDEVLLPLRALQQDRRAPVRCDGFSNGEPVGRPS